MNLKQGPGGRMKKYDDYTQEERIELIKYDTKTYLSLLTQDHLNQLLGALAKTEPLTEEEIRNI